MGPGPFQHHHATAQPLSRADGGGAFQPDIIREAINFEMSRNGQVFFINNRIQNIYEMEALVRREVPDARVAVGHGQMEPEKLEKIILDFVNYEYDVLIATSIVESGIDVPNANTIIINNAQQFGLRPPSATRTCRTKQPESLLLPPFPAPHLADAGGTAQVASDRELLRAG